MRNPKVAIEVGPSWGFRYLTELFSHSPTLADDLLMVFNEAARAVRERGIADSPELERVRLFLWAIGVDVDAPKQGEA